MPRRVFCVVSSSHFDTPDTKCCRGVGQDQCSRVIVFAENMEKKTEILMEIDNIKIGPVPFQDEYDPVGAPQYAPLETMQ